MDETPWGPRSQFLVMSDDRLYRRRQAYELRKEGKSVDFICKQLGCDHDFVHTWYERGRSGRGFHDSQRTGRPQALPPALVPEVRRNLKRKREGSAADVSKRLKREHNLNISPKTIMRHGHKAGLTSYVRPTKARLVKDDRARRLRFAKKRRPKGYWERVFWTDEKAYELHVEPRRIWAECRDEVPPRGKDLVEPTIRVWGAISARGRTPLFKIPSFWDGPGYKEFLETKALPAIREIADDDFIFMQDGDGAHKAKIVQKFLADEGVSQLESCPPRSGDLWPHENMWAITNRAVEKRNFKTLGGLWKALQEEWDNVPEETVRNLALSIRGRLKEVIQLDGGVTRH